MCVTSEPQEPVQRELTALEQEIEKQTVQLREWQMQELLKLRRQLHAPEREKQQAHLEEVVVMVTHLETDLIAPTKSHEFFNMHTHSLCVAHLHSSWLTACLLSVFFLSLFSFLGQPEVKGNGP